VSFALLLSAVPWAIMNEMRPLVGDGSIFGSSREELYTRRENSSRRLLEAVSEYVASRSCSEIGLISSVDFFEYPLWMTLSERVGGRVWMEHALVDNWSGSKASAYPYRDFRPCLIISTLSRADDDGAALRRLAERRFGSVAAALEYCHERYARLFSCSLAEQFVVYPTELAWNGAQFRRQWTNGQVSVFDRVESVDHPAAGSTNLGS
jgi:hypothetical protein